MSLRSDSCPTLKDVDASHDVGVVAKLFGNLNVAPSDELDTEAKRYRSEEDRARAEAERIRRRDRRREDKNNYFEEESDEDPDGFLLSPRRDTNPGRPTPNDERVRSQVRSKQPFALRTNSRALTDMEKVVNIKEALKDSIGFDEHGLKTSIVQAFKKTYTERYEAAVQEYVENNVDDPNALDVFKGKYMDGYEATCEKYVDGNNNLQELNDWKDAIIQLIKENNPLGGTISGGETQADVAARLEEAANAWATALGDYANDIDEKAIAISNSISTFLQIQGIYTLEKSNNDPSNPTHRRRVDYYDYVFGTLDFKAHFYAKRDFYFARAKANRMIVSGNDRRLTYAEKSELARNEMPDMGIDTDSAYYNIVSTTFATKHPARHAEAKANDENIVQVFNDEFPEEFESTNPSYWLQIAAANQVTFVESRRAGAMRAEYIPRPRRGPLTNPSESTNQDHRMPVRSENVELEDGDVNDAEIDDAENVTEGNESAFDSNARQYSPVYNKNYEDALARTLATFKGGSRGSADVMLTTYPGLYGFGSALGNVFTRDYFYDAKDPNFDFRVRSKFIRYPNSEVYYGNPELQVSAETNQDKIQDRITLINERLTVKHPDNDVFVRLPNYAADPYNKERDSLDVNKIHADNNENHVAIFVKRKRVYTDENLEDEILPIEPGSLLSRRIPGAEYVWVYNDPIKLKLRRESRVDLDLLTPWEKAYAEDLAQQIGTPDRTITAILNKIQDGLRFANPPAPPEPPSRAAIPEIERTLDNKSFATLSDWFELVTKKIESESIRLAKKNSPEAGTEAWDKLSAKILKQLKAERKKRTDIDDDLAPTDENMLPLPGSPIWLDAERLLYFVNHYRYTDQTGRVKADAIYHMDSETFDVLLGQLLDRIPEKVQPKVTKLAEAMRQLDSAGLPTGENPLLTNATELLKFTQEKIDKLDARARADARTIRQQVANSAQANSQLMTLALTLNTNKKSIETTLKERIRNYVYDTFGAYWAKYIQPNMDKLVPMPPPPPPTGPMPPPPPPNASGI